MNWQKYVSYHEYLTVNGMTCKVYWSNGKYIGECVQDVDGFWKFWFTQEVTGAFEGYELEAISAMLKHMNAAWEAEIKEYFENERLEEPGTSLDAEGE